MIKTGLCSKCHEPCTIHTGVLCGNIELLGVDCDDICKCKDHVEPISDCCNRPLETEAENNEYWLLNENINIQELQKLTEVI